MATLIYDPQELMNAFLVMWNIILSAYIMNHIITHKLDLNRQIEKLEEKISELGKKAKA